MDVNMLINTRDLTVVLPRLCLKVLRPFPGFDYSIETEGEEDATSKAAENRLKTYFKQAT